MIAPGSGSRRRAIATLLATWPCLRAAKAAAAADPIMHLAISESMVVDVNLADARAAMQTWIKRIQSDLNITIEVDAKVFSSTEEIVRLIRNGKLDAAALSVVEYRLTGDLLDTSEIYVGAGTSGPDEYLLLVKSGSGFNRLADLRGHRVGILKAPKMCVAPAWLATILDDEHLGPVETFFGPMTWDTKVSRVVLPVFFGQQDACLTSKRGFEMMCELNPQVARSMTVIAASPLLVAIFYAFRKGYQNVSRERFFTVHKNLLSSPAGRQLATLFQFDELSIRDSSCLTSSLGILDKAERLRSRLSLGGRKEQP
jgi:ABC-type phosphate/phosphonate transport system substrate-binding protein